MKPIIIGIIAVVIFTAGFVVADIIVGENQGVLEQQLGTDYNYQFILNVTGSCDLHYLRPRMYYEMGRYPDQLSLAYPNLVIGFFKPLTKLEETNLLRIMNNDTLAQEACNYPEDVYFEYKTRIHPEMFETLTGNRLLDKPIYYADEDGYVHVLVRQDLNLLQQSAFENELCNMWEKVRK